MNLRAALMEALADGEWHKVGELYNRSQACITPERAIRRYVLEYKPVTSEMYADADRIGRWRIVQYYLCNLKSQGIAEARGKGMQREYRKISDTPTRRRRRTRCDTNQGNAS